MTTYIIQEQTLTDIANAIRTKTSDDEPIQVSDYANEITNIPTGGSGLDWSAIGYSDTPQPIIDGYNYAKQIYDNWDETKTSFTFEADTNLMYFPKVNTTGITSMISALKGCNLLMSFPLIDTSNVTEMRFAFQDCANLKYFPQLNTSKLTRLSSMFSNCPNLNDESLNNILKMCININPNYSRTKTLYELGFRSSLYTSSKIQSLSSYQAFINAGWTIGY